MTGALAVAYVLAGSSASSSTLGPLLQPSSDVYPSDSLYPGAQATIMGVGWVLAGVSASTSTAKAGTTDLAGVAETLSNLGGWRAPSSGIYPSSSLYPGLTTTELAVEALGQGAVLITLTASVDVLITLEATADVSGTLQSNALLVTLGAS
jgi:hypothetical protein